MSNKSTVFLSTELGRASFRNYINTKDSELSAARGKFSFVMTNRKPDVWARELITMSIRVHLLFLET